MKVMEKAERERGEQRKRGFMKNGELGEENRKEELNMVEVNSFEVKVCDYASSGNYKQMNE